MQAQRRSPERWQVGRVPEDSKLRVAPRPQRSGAQVRPCPPGARISVESGCFLPLPGVCLSSHHSSRCVAVKCIPDRGMLGQRPLELPACLSCRPFRSGTGWGWDLTGSRCRQAPPQTLRQAILGTRNPGRREGRLGSWLWGQFCRRTGGGLGGGGGGVSIQLHVGFGDFGRAEFWGRVRGAPLETKPSCLPPAGGSWRRSGYSLNSFLKLPGFCF